MIYLKQDGSGAITVNRYPDKCPFCHKSITPDKISYSLGIERTLELSLKCPNNDCKKTFIAYYDFDGRRSPGGDCYLFLNKTTTGNLISRDFSQSITDNFQNFILIYNQAYSAEQYNLTEICGVGYRKALEFLIKDYSIQKHSSEKENIEKMTLSNCIEKFVSDANIKSVSKRAVWLGNDETHYIKKWDDKDLSHLKKLIDLTLHWIEAEMLTASFAEEMPD